MIPHFLFPRNGFFYLQFTEKTTWRTQLPVDFNEFFNIAIGKRIDPYPYQSDLAQKPWPSIIEVPTGLGKTAGIILP